MHSIRPDQSVRVRTMGSEHITSSSKSDDNSIDRSSDSGHSVFDKTTATLIIAGSLRGQWSRGATAHPNAVDFDFSASWEILELDFIMTLCSDNKNNYTFGKKLGSGKFGHVYAVHYLPTKSLVAAKSVSPNNFLHEANLLKLADHEHVVKFLGEKWISTLVSSSQFLECLRICKGN